MTQYDHKPWCAQVIAANSELPWRVKCDCKPLTPKEPQPTPLRRNDFLKADFGF